ncbi:MAG: pre-peptidase C-terminal domain-containing protein [Chloroflexi bacterium]|nr:pre-peptidase C-terminal domain-containing protein [Chloroflexota bacterium]
MSSKLVSTVVVILVIMIATACTAVENFATTTAPSATAEVVTATITIDATELPSRTAVPDATSAPMSTSTTVPIATPAVAPTPITSPAIVPTLTPTAAPSSTPTPDPTSIPNPTSTPTPSVPNTPQSDLHGDEPGTATLVQSNLPLSGQVEPVNDVDWFKFVTIGGSAYRISADGDSQSDPLLRLVDSNGQLTLIVDDNQGFGNSAAIDWVAPDSATYFFNVAVGATGNTGGYTVLVNSEVNDHSNQAAGATAITAGGSINGQIESVADRDWFTFEAVVGTKYNVDVTPTTLVNPTLRLIDSDGIKRLVTTSGIDGSNASIEWVAPASGSYYLSVGAIGDSTTGTYEIGLTSQPDDHGSRSGEGTLITPGSSVTGILESIGDQDWFVLSALAGTEYRLTLSAAPTGTHMDLFAQNGTTRLIGNSDNSGGSPIIVWTAPVTASYFVAVGAPSTGGLGNYTLTTAAISDDHSDTSVGATSITGEYSVIGDLETAGDEDWFTFDAVLGVRYTFSTTLGTLADSTLTLLENDGVVRIMANDDGGSGQGSSIEFIAPATRSYLLKVRSPGGVFTGTYTLSLTSTTDGSSNNTEIVVNGGSVSGVLEVSGGSDSYAFAAEGGRVYRFETTALTLSDPDLYIRGIDGTTVEIWDLDSGEGKAARIEWTAPASGTYWADISTRNYSGNNRTGSYELAITSEPDPQGEGATGAQVLSFGSNGANFVMATGDLETPGDSDWFAFAGIADHVYRIEANSVSLSDPDVEVFGIDGVTLEVWDYDSGEGLDARIEWIAPSTGTYFVKIHSRSYSGNPRVGGYTLFLSSEPDDHGDTTADATTLGAGFTTVGGDLEIKGDEDWFSLDAIGGNVYRIESIGISLDDPDINILGIDGVTLEAWNYDPGKGNNAQLIWQAPATGTYFINIFSRSYSGNPRTGTYLLSISSESDDHGNSSSGATVVQIDQVVASYRTLGGDLAMSGDSDIFAFVTTEGWTYWIESRGVTLSDPDLRVFDIDGTTELIVNYDSGETKAGRLKWTAPASGTYFSEVFTRNYSGNTRVGAYTLTISGEPG